MSILAQQAELALRAAYNSEFGVQVLCAHDLGNPVVTPSLRTKQILYRFRREIGDVELLKIQIRLCPHDPNNRLWLIRTQNEQGEE